MWAFQGKVFFCLVCESLYLFGWLMVDLRVLLCDFDVCIVICISITIYWYLIFVYSENKEIDNQYNVEIISLLYSDWESLGMFSSRFLIIEWLRIVAINWVYWSVYIHSWWSRVEKALRRHEIKKLIVIVRCRDMSFSLHRIDWQRIYV